MTAPALTRTSARPAASAPAAPRWHRPALAALLVGTALLYLWDLGASGYGNSYYAMAVQAGTQSWKAWFFGALDPSGVITVDKPPASLWLMGLSGRVFGFSSWSVLAPNALAGVGSVALLYGAVKRYSGPAAGLLAGTVLALTPVAAVMFRFDNPDALLVLLLVAGAYCTVRATEKASTGWLLLAGSAIGFGFLTKMLQAFLVLPAFALVYLIAAPAGIGRRIWQLLAAAGAVVVAAGWWIAAVALWPAADRPYIGGSETNSALELAFGYNGLGRIFGGEGNRGGGGPGGSGGAMGGNAGFGGGTGLGRMFGESFGTEISWLLPAALIGLVAGLWFTRRAPRTDRTRAALLLWGGWLVVTALVFSYMGGTIHPYYAVALAPAIAALVAISGRELWRGRANFAARSCLALMLASAGVWGFVLLTRFGTWQPWLKYVVLAAAALGVLALLFGGRVRQAAPLLLAGVLCGGLIAAAGFTVATAATPHTGSIPTSGPISSGFGGGPGEGRSDTAVTALLSTTDTQWAAAAGGAQEAAGLALSSGKPVLAIGGFTGRDPAPTLAEFEQYVADGKVRYYLAGGRGGFGGGPGGSNEIATWVADNFSATTVGSSTVYDLAKPLS
ncbi:ArnT family glycosyltransferase [Amycolatopsis minnesotensis]|uniref:Glycosyltransferase family 39 protein n=1 Tax=Amycolatopsis minnesotensis TaxID=337894 RepID=A0ABN2SDL6_9PSEU